MRIPDFFSFLLVFKNIFQSDRNFNLSFKKSLVEHVFLFYITSVSILLFYKFSAHVLSFSINILMFPLVDL